MRLLLKSGAASTRTATLILAALNFVVPSAHEASAAIPRVQANEIWVPLCSADGYWLVSLRTGRRIPISPDRDQVSPCHGAFCRRDDDE